MAPPGRLTHLGLISPFTGIGMCGSTLSIIVIEKQTSQLNATGAPSLAVMAPLKTLRRNGYTSFLGRSERIAFWHVKCSTLKLPT